MKNTHLIFNALLVLFFAFASGTECLGQSYWTRSYGDGFIFRIIPASDGNFLLAGQKGSDAYLIKINPDGDTLWTKTYGETNSSFISLLPDPDGNFICAGQREGHGRLVKFTPGGDTLWTKTFQDDDSYFSTTMYPAADGDFLFTGGAAGKAWLVRLTANGDTVWTRTYGTSPSSFTTIHETDNHDFFLVGRGQNIGWVVKINPDGDTLWTRTYADTASMLQWILPVADDHFLFAGSLAGKGWLVKTDLNGDIVWTKTYGDGYAYFNSVLNTPDGNYIVAGQQSDQMTARPLVMKISPDGDTLWTQTYMNNGHTMLFISASDGIFLLSGITTEGPEQYCWLMSIIDNQYAYESESFTFTVPVEGSDPSAYVYTPLKAPADMTVSPDGTISWTPATDAAYREYIELSVTDNNGRDDTLTFSIFVNADYRPMRATTPFPSDISNETTFDIITRLSSVMIKIPVNTTAVSSLSIYDISGKLVDRIVPTGKGSGAYILWNGTTSAGGTVPGGTYFAEMACGMNCHVMPFTVVR